MSHSHLNPGLISAYNSLTDKHLAGYFSSSRIRRHLQRAGLITRSGRIVPDKEYRQRLIQKAHQRHVRECLAQAIFHKVLEMERLHQIEIKRKLEEFARRDRVHKIKVERSKRYEEDIIRLLSPRPPTGARGIRKQHSGPEGEHTESSESPGSSRPNTAPGKMQRPVRLKPLQGNGAAPWHRHSSPYRRPAPPHDSQRPLNGTVDKDPHRRVNSMEVRNGVSPYCLPVINNFVTPVPPSTKRKEGPLKLSTSSTHRGRRLRPPTTSSGADVSEEPPVLRSSVPPNRVCVNMVYLGKSVHLYSDLPDMRDEVRVFQQHCGGENLCVYKGKLREGESFQFISRRHRGFPFSLTFFLNGLQVERLSSCCEFKHRKSSRLGGRHGHFAFAGIEAASPCYKCIIAMGLDKKPVPPPKREKEDGYKVGIVPRLTVTAGADAETPEDHPASRPEGESSPTKEANAKEDEAPGDSKAKDEYEEDFEADDEGPVEKGKKRTSPNEEKEEKESDSSDSEDCEKDDDKKSGSGSSLSGSESDAEEVTEAREEEGQDEPEDAQEVQEEVAAARAAESEFTEAKDCEVQDSAGQSTEIEISDAERRATSDTQTAAEGERSTEDEPERAKSVQEKLAEAVLKESQCSSEPELSDSSTETEVSSSTSTRQGTKVGEPVTETSTTQAEVIEEEKKSEETLVNEEAKPEDEKTHEEIVGDETTQNDEVTEETATCEEEIVEEVQCSPPRDDPGEEAEKDEEGKQEAVQKGEESSGVETKPDETAEPDDTEPPTVTETMEMKAEAADTQEPVNSVVAPATDTKANEEENTGQEGEVTAKEEGHEETENANSDGDKTQEKDDAEIVSEEAETNANLDGQDRDEGVKSEADDLENRKLESEVTKEENKAEGEDAVMNLNTEDQKEEENKAPSEEDASDKRTEEIEKTETCETREEKGVGEDVKEEVQQTEVKSEVRSDSDTKDESENIEISVQKEEEQESNDKPMEELEPAETDGVQTGDESGEKCIDEDVTKTSQNEAEVQQTDSEVRNDADNNLDESEAKESSVPKEEREQETSAHSIKSDNGKGDAEEAPKEEENKESSVPKEEKEQDTSAQSIKSDNGKGDAEEAPKEEENKESSVPKEEKEQETSAQSIKSDDGKGDAEEAPKEEENKGIINDVVDAENGEVSVVAETKQTDEDEQKLEERDDITQVEQSEKQEEETELKQNDDGRDLNHVASSPSVQEGIVEVTNKVLDTTENNNSLEIPQSDSGEPTGERAAAVDAFAAEGENGDTEEASKASEEGASVLLKPYGNEQSDHTGQKGSPAGLTTANSTDMVNNWVTMHQTSKYFETFVEPLEEMRDSETSNAQSVVLPRPESPMVKDGGDEIENETKDEASDHGSKRSEAKQDVAQAGECQIIHAPIVENEESIKESIIEESLKDDKNDQSMSEIEKNDSLARLNNNLTRTSITSSHLSVTSGKHETLSESLNEDKGSNHEQQAKTEEFPENPATTSEDTQENSKEVMAATDFTAVKSDNGSSVGEDAKVIETVSKEHLSTFSVDGSVFGNNSFPLTTASKAENGH